ncbi:hypothetical protein [Streptomyces sp. NPDC058953]|uniref:hypothetical protein n=1 Tax=unclassified Streptomyces TaxID=2593676 RepID=UPI00368ACDA4
MRGLTGGRGGSRWAASGTAMAGLAVLVLFAAGCSTGGTGLRDDGPAAGDAGRSASSGVPTPSGPGSPGSAAKAKMPDPVALLRKDPKVDAGIKADLKPCVEGTYPVDTAVGHLTGGTAPDVVVNIMTCDDAIAIATYVYRLDGSDYRNVFARVEPAVFSTIDRGDLVVTQQVYENADPIATPMAEEIRTYRWTTGTDGGRFVETHWTRTQYRTLPPEDGDAYQRTEETEPGTRIEQGGTRGGASGTAPSVPPPESAIGASDTSSGTSAGGDTVPLGPRFHSPLTPVVPAAPVAPDPAAGTNREKS